MPYLKVRNNAFRKLTLSLPGTKERHQRKSASFQINNWILAVHRKHNKQAVIKFSIADQFTFSSIMITTIYPVKGGWGKTGCMTNWI